MPFRDLPGVTKCRFKKGETILKAGEPVEYVYYLTKGTVYREMITAKGYESILSCKKASDVADALVGVLTLYNMTHNAISRYSFIAHTDCTCYQIPRDVCKTYLREHPDLLERVLSHAMREYTQLMNLFMSQREGSGAARLCALLLERAKQNAEGTLVVPKKCTNVELSKLLSIHKVTVSRMIRALREEGVVERVEVGMIVLQPERLKQYADNEDTLIYE